MLTIEISNFDLSVCLKWLHGNEIVLSNTRRGDSRIARFCFVYFRGRFVNRPYDVE